MLEPRVYRAAFIPALLAAVLAMFSLESRPRPLPQGLPADILFDGDLAAAGARAVVAAEPDRRPGSVGNRRTAGVVAQAFERRGFRVERDRFTRDGKDLENVIGRRAGQTRRQIVLVAARDASGVPDAPTSGADTAALLELARVFQGRPTRHTLVLASVDGSTLGEVGAARLEGELGPRDLVDAVLVMSNLGSARGSGSAIVPWSNDSSRMSIGLERTLAESIRQELERAVGETRVAGQLSRLAFPIGVGGQGALLERGFEAVRISGSGQLPPEGRGGLDELDRDTLGGLGRATLRTVTAVDQGRRAEHGPDSYLTVVSQVVPGWVISLLALALLLPAVVAGIDAFARARRRRVPVAPWLRWVGAAAGALLAGLALAELLAIAGATPEPPPAPAAPEDYPLDGAALAVLAGIATVVGLVWVGARFLTVHGDPRLADLGAPGAASAAALAMSAAVLALWLVSPYAALVWVPAAHLWMLATLSDPAPGRRARLILLGVGLLPPLAVALYHLFALDLDPVSGAWYLLLLVTGHHVGLITALIGCVLLAVLGSVIPIARSIRDEEPPAVEEGPPVYGPGTYAGPGSLGGTESALRR